MADCDDITLNNLAPTQFKVVLKRAPQLVYRAQQVSLPGMDLPPANVPTPTVDLPMPGDHVQFGQFTMQFILDENLSNYKEVFNWMVALAPPENLREYILKNREIGKDSNPYQDSIDASWMSDIEVLTLTSGSNPNITFNLKDCYPTSLSPIDFNTQDTSVEYVTASATFMVRNFTVD